MPTTARMLCPECGRPVKVTATPTNPAELTVSIDWDSHDCRPHLLRFFETESQHYPPFGR